MRSTTAGSSRGSPTPQSSYRNLVERFPAVATRYDKRDDNFLASVQLASIRIWLRQNESVG